MTNAISSPESEFGGTRFAELGGLTIVEFGAGLAPANLSARQAGDLGLMTSGTCGPRGSTSSRSAALQESLASRLQARTGSGGSTLYRLTWKTRVTPSGRPICALRGSPNKAARVADFICASGSISSGCLAGWSTPVTNDAEKRGAVDPMRGGNGLAGQGNLAGWPTASARDHKDSCGMAETGVNPDGSTRDRTDQLPRKAALAGWDGDQTAFLILSPDGQTRTSHIAATGSGVRLNPAHSRWLMRFPVQWEQCAPNYEPYALLQELMRAT